MNAKKKKDSNFREDAYVTWGGEEEAEGEQRGPRR